MGRKPNQLILEFFERGQKLEDASNRYQHTCKACGEKFPKGRIDSLTTHLVKKCPAIALRDRQRALLQLHELPDFTDSEAGSFIEGGRELPERGRTLDLPYANNRNWTALETLAEVSRHFDMSEKRSPGPRDTAEDDTASNIGTEGRFESDYHWNQDTPTGSFGIGDRPDDLLIDPALASPLPPIQILGQISDSPSSSPHLPGLSLPSSSSGIALHPSPLSLTDNSANDASVPITSNSRTLEPDLGVPNASISDKFFHPQGPRSTSTWPMLQRSPPSEPAFFDGSRDQGAKFESTARAATFPRAIAMNPNTPQREFSAEFSNSPKPSRPKVRGRFSASRRKEVQEVRKRGACIRCRMLKKPCSGASPCSTCISVESARLWKQPCIRTRIADELELYSAGLYGVLAFHDINQAKNRVHFQSFQGRIEVTHYLDSCTFITFSALEGRKPGRDIGRARDYDLGDSLQDEDLRLLDYEVDDLPAKLEQYMKKMAPTFHEREPSNFMKPTLKLAAELSVQKKDMLLTRVLELWTATHILVDLEMRWKTFSNPTLPPSTSLAAFPSSHSPSAFNMDENRTPIDDTTDPESYALLCSQLRSAAEKRAAHLSKSVMNDLERRLLQRQSSGWFETFLVAIVLLNCVERTSWLFRTWEDEQYFTKWPLDRRPPYYFLQGERFADMVHMLLKMRGLPPKTQARPEDGLLLTAEGTDEVAAIYFNTINISIQHLEERQNAEFDPEESRSLELKYCSKLLLPSG
ncbi:MAG: hypothetical protein M1827_006473 [Pycnora praestabilis]|nr:MAG: hypothetical protein M1827_006473 [Pycnora praestabilis]